MKGLKQYDVMSEQSSHQKSKSCLALISSLKTKNETFIHLVHKAANSLLPGLYADFPVLENVSFRKLQEYNARRGYFKSRL